MLHPSIRLEGSLLSADILDAIERGEKSHQGPRDFGLEGTAKVKDEIAEAWAAARTYWAAYQVRLGRLREGATGTSETRNLWMVPFLELLGYPCSHALRGLTNIAAKASHKVLQILETLTIPENPTVKDQLLRILAEIQEPSLIERVLAMAARVIKTPPFTNIIWIDQILTNAKKTGALDPTLQLIHTFLNVTLSANSIQAIDTWQIGEIDRDILAPISESLPIPSARVVFNTFVKWADIQRDADSNHCNQIFEVRSDSSPDDADSPSSYWLEDFHGLQSPGMGFHDFEVFLAHRLFGIGSLIFRSKKAQDIAELDEMLRSNSWNLFARLRWQLYADFPDQTLQYAKKDFVSSLSLLGHYSEAHGYEMAQMLENHSLLHGDRFLNPDEVRSIVDIIRSGPVDREGKLEDQKYLIDKFQRQQLHPLRCLLKNGDLEFYKSLNTGVPEIKSENYKPLSTGRVYTVEQVPPAKAAEMASMTDSALWKFLNEWVADSKYHDSEHGTFQEDVGALAVKFAELLESTPSRFNATTLWWKNLTQPIILSTALERATARISEAAMLPRWTSRSRVAQRRLAEKFGMHGWPFGQARAASGKNGSPMWKAGRHTQESMGFRSNFRSCGLKSFWSQGERRSGFHKETLQEKSNGWVEVVC